MRPKDQHRTMLHWKKIQLGGKTAMQVMKRPRRSCAKEAKALIKHWRGSSSQSRSVDGAATTVEISIHRIANLNNQVGGRNDIDQVTMPITANQEF